MTVVVTSVTRVPSVIYKVEYSAGAKRPGVLYTRPESVQTMSPDDISTLIRAAIPDANVSVRDTTGGGDHFDATVVSAAFAGKGPVERHRLVYAALSNVINGPAAPIHALALTTATPEEYQHK